MARVQGRINQSLEEASAALRREAAAQGYAWAEGESRPDVLVFKKGMSAWSWGSKLTVELHESSPSVTGLTLSTHETFAIIDWGKGRRAAQRLLNGLNAEEH